MTTSVAIVIEDEPHIRGFVRVALEAEGWQVHEAGTRARGLTEAGTRQPQLLIVDIGLPDGSGIDLVREVRTWSSVAIIVLSARSDEADKIAALDAGADDYLTKPFGVGELMARVRANQRRGSRALINGSGTVAASAPFVFGAVTFDAAARTVLRHGIDVHLTPIEFRLLAVLVTNVGRVMTHRQLLKAVWGPSHIEHHHYTRIYMANLRKKLEDDPAQPVYLLTENAVGYRLAAT